MLNICTTCIPWEIGSYNTQQCLHMNIRTFVTILSRKAQYNFPKMRGGAKGRLELFRKFIRFGRGMLPLVFFGGQTVTMGKSRSSMGRVVIEVAMGCSCHSLYDSPIRIPAPRNPRQTIPNHKVFADLL